MAHERTGILGNEFCIADAVMAGIAACILYGCSHFIYADYVRFRCDRSRNQPDGTRAAICIDDGRRIKVFQSRKAHSNTVEYFCLPSIHLIERPG